MVTLEQVEKLREKTNLSYDEAKAELEKTNGDILEAIINLEKENRIPAPEGGGYYNSRKVRQNSESDYRKDEPEQVFSNDEGSGFGDLVSKFFKWCGKIINLGNRNNFEVRRCEEKIITVPVTVLVLLLLFAFWIIVPLIIIGLFFGYRYKFIGPDLGKEKVNSTLDSVAEAAEKLKKEVRDSKSERANRENPDNRG
jgi:hypothetical protein